jgi:hypothetical protein
MWGFRVNRYDIESSGQLPRLRFCFQILSTSAYDFINDPFLFVFGNPVLFVKLKSLALGIFIWQILFGQAPFRVDEQIFTMRLYAPWFHGGNLPVEIMAAQIMADYRALKERTG